MSGFELMTSMSGGEADRLTEAKDTPVAELAERFGIAEAMFHEAQHDVGKALEKAAWRVAELMGGSQTKAAAAAWEVAYTLTAEICSAVNAIESVEELHAFVVRADSEKPPAHTFLGYVSAARVSDAPTGDFITDARHDRNIPNAKSWEELRGYLRMKGAGQPVIDAAHAVWQNYRAWQRR